MLAEGGRPASAGLPQGRIGHRIETLDSLRGVAAFSVVLAHCLLATAAFLPAYQYRPVTGLVWLLSQTPLRIFWAGQEAVMIFFVLSGYVLSLPFWAGRAPAPIRFGLKRIIRLYPPYLAAVLVAMALMTLIASRPAHFDALGEAYWSRPVSWPMIRDHLLMLPTANLDVVDGPVWSLVVEMHVSLLFPFLMMAMRVLGPWSLLPAIALALAQRFVALPLFAHYLWLFVAGAELARRYKAVDRIARAAPGFWQGMFLAASLLLLILHWLLPGIPGMGSFGVGVGALGVVLACRHFAMIAPLLSRPGLVWLGAISYSLYLIHFPIQLALMSLLDRRFPEWAVLLLDVPVALLAAALLHRWVERPSIALSHRVQGR